MRDQIELHDSNAVFSYLDHAVVIEMCPAYVHHWELIDGNWVGTGRLQAARMVVSGVFREPVIPSEQVELSGGVAHCGAKAFSNLIPVPFHDDGAVRLSLEVEMADPLDLAGTGFTAELVGDWQEIESLPGEWAPSGGVG